MACGSTTTIKGLVAGTFVFGLIFGAFASAQDRMPPIPADKLTPAQKKTVDEYKKARGGESWGPVGRADTKSGTDVTHPDAE